jgi:hypothetical protein
LHDLLLLGLYSCVPGRGNEVRLLQYIFEEAVRDQIRRRGNNRANLSLKKWVHKQKINLITTWTTNDVSMWKMLVSQYKNYRLRGVDVTELTASKWWTDLLATYLADYHPLLRHGIEHEFIFMTRQGTPFKAPYFSEFLSSLLFRHTGQRVAVNMLRSSFVTHFYSSDAAQDPSCASRWPRSCVILSTRR